MIRCFKPFWSLYLLYFTFSCKLLKILIKTYRKYFIKPTINLFALLLIISFFSCKPEKKESDNEVHAMWTSFLSNLDAQDKVAFKNASGEAIRCYDCLENTPSERQKMNILRGKDSLWYKKMYETLIYIPIDSFTANDYDILFNPQFVNILQENETKIIRDETNDITYAHILVTTTLPTLNFEGAQHSFSFVKGNDGQWKLNEINTIP